MEVPKSKKEWIDFHSNPKSKKWRKFRESSEWIEAFNKAEIKLSLELINIKLDYLLGRM